MRASHGLMLLLLLPGCRGNEVEPAAPGDWAVLPTTSGEAASLVRERTRRPVEERRGERPPDVGILLERLRGGPRVAGWARVVETLQRELHRSRSSVLLVGNVHDAGGQVDAFRRLVGPSGLRGLRAVAVELLAADGRWRGAPESDQRGLSAAVGRYLARGDRAALSRVQRALPWSTYTAWKYRYTDKVLDLLITARASGLTLLPCDMPRPLQRRAPADHVDRLRELHCLLALDQAKVRGRVAMLWGQAHLAPAALPRFLPRTTRVIRLYLFGHRPGPAGPELGLKGRLLLTDPVLLSLEGEARYALLLDGPLLGARLHRSRDVLTRPLTPERRHRLEVTLEGPGRLVLAGRQVEIGAGTTAVPVVPGTHAYVLESGGRLLAGALEMPRGGALELTVRPVEGEAELVVQTSR